MKYIGSKGLEIGFLSSFLTLMFWKSYWTLGFNVSSSIRTVLADIISYDLGLLIMYILILIGTVGLVILAIYLEKSSDREMTQTYDIEPKNKMVAFRATICLMLFSMAVGKTLSYGHSYVSLSPSYTAMIIYILSQIVVFIFFSLWVIEIDRILEKNMEKKALGGFLWIVFGLSALTFMFIILEVEGKQISDAYHFYAISIWITMAVLSGLRALEIRKNSSILWNSITVIMSVLFAVYLIWAMLELGLI